MLYELRREDMRQKLPTEPRLAELLLLKPERASPNSIKGPALLPCLLHLSSSPPASTPLRSTHVKHAQVALTAVASKDVGREGGSDDVSCSIIQTVS